MLTFTEKARALAQEKKRPIYLEMSPTIKECCFAIRESPSIHFGAPKNRDLCNVTLIDGITVYTPKELPEIPLTVSVRKLFGI
ncbi:hypothetical protein SCACP_24630 [Sporomusa carbonis]|uniref:CC/Se motif family (seleno)protein n=1 Tax=Sporomusa carbonis TaxID=3076075 RepID=UPI003A68F350